MSYDDLLRMQYMDIVILDDNGHATCLGWYSYWQAKIVLLIVGLLYLPHVFRVDYVFYRAADTLPESIYLVIR